MTSVKEAASSTKRSTPLEKKATGLARVLPFLLLAPSGLPPLLRQLAAPSAINQVDVRACMDFLCS